MRWFSTVTGHRSTVVAFFLCPLPRPDPVWISNWDMFRTQRPAFSDHLEIFTRNLWLALVPPTRSLPPRYLLLLQPSPTHLTLDSFIFQLLLLCLSFARSIWSARSSLSQPLLPELGWRRCRQWGHGPLSALWNHGKKNRVERRQHREKQRGSLTDREAIRGMMWIVKRRRRRRGE